jgi:hypothetical protein
VCEIRDADASSSYHLARRKVREREKMKTWKKKERKRPPY